MRIILVGSVSTVKRLRVSLGTLVAIEATVDGNAATADAVGGTDARFIARRRAPDAGCPTTLAEAATEVVPTARAKSAAAAVAAESAPAEPVGAGLIATESAFADAEVSIARAFDAIEQVNRLMHPHAEGSDLARINRAPPHTPTKVHASVGQLLNLAKRINTLTDGVFDPCTPAQPGRLSDVVVSTDETEVVCHAPVALDFGGFAKGYAVDCAIEALMAGGCTAGLVNAGGDMRVFGQRGEPVFVRGLAGELAAIELVDAALAVSDATSGQRPPEHQGYYVRNSEQTTTPDTATTHAAITAPTAVIADAMAKCVLLCPPPVSARVLHEFRATLLRTDGRADQAASAEGTE